MSYRIRIAPEFIAEVVKHIATYTPNIKLFSQEQSDRALFYIFDVSNLSGIEAVPAVAIPKLTAQYVFDVFDQADLTILPLSYAIRKPEHASVASELFELIPATEILKNFALIVRALLETNNTNLISKFLALEIIQEDISRLFDSNMNVTEQISFTLEQTEQWLDISRSLSRFRNTKRA